MAIYTYSPWHRVNGCLGYFSAADFDEFISTVDRIRIKEHYAKIILTNPYDRTFQSIALEGLVTQGSISVNGNSAIRRSGSLTIVVPPEEVFKLQYNGQTINKVTSLQNLISINKRAEIQIGYKPLTPFSFKGIDYEELWFPLGTFVLQNPSVTHNNSGVQIQVKLSDLMTLFNGTNGGDLPMAIVHSPIVNKNGEDENVTFKELIETLVVDFGEFPRGFLVLDKIPETLDEQIYRWCGEGNLYAIKPTNPADKQWILTREEPETAFDMFENQDPVGVKSGEPFTYPGKLSSNPGESIVSVLDKIKKTLGNYEYFFDIEGKFHFQPIENGLNDGVKPNNLTEAIQAKYFGKTLSKAVYSFTDGILISSYSNTPRFDALKNDLTVWGKNGNNKLGIRYHLLIDTKPDGYNKTTFYCQPYMDDFGVERIFTASTDSESPHTLEITPTDWRQYLYLRAVERSTMTEMDRVTGLTVLEKELIEEWPKIYNVTGEAGFFNDANPVALTYWLDMIDVKDLTGEDVDNQTLIEDMTITQIGDRSKTYNDDKLNCLFAPSAATIRLFDSEPKQEEIANVQKYAVVTPDDPIYQDLAKGTSHNPAFDYIRSVLHEHIGANNSISIQTMPLYHLEPNMRIKVENDEADIHGEYIINSLTMPLTVNGMMTIQASKAVERI